MWDPNRQSKLAVREVRARPRRRRFKAFTTSAKFIRLIRRCVALFPTAVER